MKFLRKMIARMPWDERYVKISFHVIFTLVAVYALAIFVSFIARLLSNPSGTAVSLSEGFKWVCALLSPLIIACFIAYILNPVADFFQACYEKLANVISSKTLNNNTGAGRTKKNNTKKAKKAKKKDSLKKEYKKRAAGAALSYLAILFALIFFMWALLVRIGGKVSGSWIDNAFSAMMHTLDSLEEFTTRIELKLLEWGAADFFSKYISEIVAAFGDMIKGISTGMAGSIANAGEWMTSFVLGLVIAFYFIMDKEAIMSGIQYVLKLVLPSNAFESVKKFSARTNRVLSNYIRGVLTEAIILAFMIGGWLALLGVDFAFAIGVISGIANIIPYVGAVVAFTLAVLVALIGGDPLIALFAAAGILVIQQIDGSFVQPRVVGVNVKLSPPTVIVSLFVFGKLFGVWGMILAVPMCAIIKMMFEDYLNEKAEENTEENTEENPQTGQTS